MHHCTDPDCLGWTFDGLTARIQACSVCQVFKTDVEAVLAFLEFRNGFSVPVTDGQCSLTCRGWDLFEAEASMVPGTYLDICDDCKVFPDGDTAVTKAMEWILVRRAEVAEIKRRHYP